MKPTPCRFILFFCVFHASFITGTLLANEVERWGLFELAIDGPASGNPFTDVELSARFRHSKREVEVSGFYNGDGKYLVRFSPDEIGDWTYETYSNRPELIGKSSPKIRIIDSARFIMVEKSTIKTNLA